ncbi:hypothetical protein [Citricoccus sp.]|uniref:hypothetical protein n=1 Tax=Citricoccus sp. TaxID=1978372 RepID=UPI0028BE8F7B|nr:hypothetical protein [Citricoccus sp.]
MNDTTTPTAAASFADSPFSTADSAFSNIDCDPDLSRPLPSTGPASQLWVLAVGWAWVRAVAVRLAERRSAPTRP